MVAWRGRKKKRNHGRRAVSSDGSCRAEFAREREENARKGLKVWRGGEKELGE